jgi:trimethylamine--corrinoid protein Co-methyltransferase
MGSSDAKFPDVQGGIESAGGTILAALSGVNMVSGAGMLDYLRCQSFEKLVIDAEIISIAKRLIKGIEKRDESIALDLMRAHRYQADFLSLPHTHEWFRKEFYIPTEIVDRGSLDAWTRSGRKSMRDRSADRVDKLLTLYKPNNLSQATRIELRKIASLAARKHGMQELPSLPD